MEPSPDLETQLERLVKQRRLRTWYLIVMLSNTAVLFSIFTVNFVHTHRMIADTKALSAKLDAVKKQNEDTNKRADAAKAICEDLKSVPDTSEPKCKQGQTLLPGQSCTVTIPVPPTTPPKPLPALWPPLWAL